MINCFLESDFLSPLFFQPTQLASPHGSYARNCAFSLLPCVHVSVHVCEKIQKELTATASHIFLWLQRGFVILSSQMFNNSYFYIGGYLTHDRQTVCSSFEWCLGAPLAVKPIRESSPRHQSLAHHFASLFDSRLPGGACECMFSMHTHMFQK